ncbi:MAG: hypothetical protein C5B52_04160 [Bacteroidetes bacterium]|nr:MAG: hypothetical protein C5B52_04160 [Bacteroidota bacterium]
METCKNCNHPVADKFCPNCGQSAHTPRFSGKELFHEFMHGFLHLDHGIFFTMKELLLRPGTTIKNYLHGKRKSYFNPFTYILVLSAFTAFLISKIHWGSLLVEIGIVQPGEVDAAAWKYSLKHFSWRLLLGIPVAAFVSRIFYYKHEFNFSELMIANSYLRGQIDLFMLILFALLSFVHLQVVRSGITIFFLSAWMIYIAWAFAGLFNDKINIWNFIKGFFCALICFILEMLILNLVILRRLDVLF